MKSSIIFILTILCLSNCSETSQQIVKSKELTKELTMLSIADKNLTVILDSIICFEKRCNYYSDSLLFTINIRQVNDIYELQIESSNNVNDVLDYFEPIYGYFYFNDHLFFVFKPESKILFSLTDSTKQFNYTKFLKSNNKSKQIKIIDDSHSYWNYWIANQIFIFKGKSSPCE